MYKKILLMSFMTLSLNQMSANNDVDSITPQTLSEVSVVSIRNHNDKNLSKQTISGDELSVQNIGQNLPFLLSSTPSMVVTSDDGLGVGYTYFRIRGTDHTRINMTVNGIPLNDSESQTVFWVNMTDFASSLRDVQVQRGVGSSTNGSSAFGASVNMQTEGVSPKPYATLSFNGGMYNTFREMAKVGTGLMPSGFSFDAKFSKINSKGYVERAFSDLYSYSASALYFRNNTMIKLLVFGGKEKTYMAWDGISAKQMKKNRRFNPAGADYDEKGNLVGFYDNQTDNYRQNHLQLHFAHFFTNALSLSIALHYTNGFGYYEQFKDNAKLSSYNLQKYNNGGNEMKRTDIVRRKNLDNDFYGGIWSLNYIKDKFDIYFGGGINNYVGNHFGNVIYAKQYPLMPEKDYEYYRNTGRKTDGNFYLKGAYKPIEGLVISADMQFRYIKYSIKGINDEDLRPIDIPQNYPFFNPKAGISYSKDGHNTYFSFAVANREPSRSNFKEAGMKDIPKAERLFDYELGYNYATDRFGIGANLYFMNYKNQLVLTGKYSDTGAYLTKNVDKSYRAGIEIIAGVQILKWFRWDGNVALSRNRIVDFVDWFDVYQYDSDPDKSEWADNVEVRIGETDISFSPSITANSNFNFNYKGFDANIQTLVVGKQYLDNTMSSKASLPAYSATNIALQYSLPIKNVVENIVFSFHVNNLFNSLFASNGGTYSSFLFKKGEEKNYSIKNLQCSPWFYAQAGINVHAGVKVNF